MSVQIRDYRPGPDDDAVLSLRAAVWGVEHHHNKAAYFDWLYQRNPAGPGSGVLLTSGGTAVGFLGLTARQISYRGEKLRVAHGVDYMVDPKLRSGLSGPYAFRILARWVKTARISGYRFGMGFPNESSYRIVAHPKLRWNSVFSPSLMVRPLSNVRFHTSPLKGMPAPLLTMGSRMLAQFCTLAALGRRSRIPGRAVETETFDARFDTLWAEVSSDLGIATWRDSEYLNWRYTNHPLYSYYKFAWQDGEKLFGFIVTSHREIFGIPTLLVVDVLALDTPCPITDALLLEAIAQAARSGCQMVVALAVAPSPLYRALRRVGFQRVPHVVNPKPFVLYTHDLGYQDLQTALPLVNDPRGWHVCWGDMDVA